MTLISSPLISIVMPAHNAALYITDAINSILLQTYPVWELIIVDDASTDNTKVKISHFSDARIRLIETARLGTPGSVRNLGICYARGSFIAFLDADDAYFPDALEAMIGPMLAKPNIIACMGFPYYCDADLNPASISRHLMTNSEGQVVFRPEYQLNWENICAQQLEFFMCCTMIRKDVVDQIGGMDEQLQTSEDFKYHIQLFQYGFEKIKVIPRSTYYYRQYRGSITKDPERLYRQYPSHVEVVNWLFAQSFIPASCRSMKATNLAIRLATMAMAFVSMNRPDLARLIIADALNSPDIPLTTWLKFFWKQLLKAYAPDFLRELYLTRCARDGWRYA